MLEVEDPVGNGPYDYPDDDPAEPERRRGVLGVVRGLVGLLVVAALVLASGGAGVGYLLSAGAFDDGSGPEHAGSYSLRTAGGSVVRWDPCVPVRFELNPAGAPPGAEAVTASVLSELSEATGLELVLAGRTDRKRSDPLVPDPVTVAWVPPDAAAFSDSGDALGLATTYHVNGRYVTGTVLVDRSRDLSQERLRVVLLHEVGHLLGLDHTSDPTQVLAPRIGAQRSLGSGDLAGLAALGGTCTSEA